jgi:Uma2 family endonuclease
MTTTLEKNSLLHTGLVVSGVEWSQFLALETAFADIEGIRFTYLDGVLEIMPESIEHEDIKSTIRVLLEAYLRHAGIRFYVRGNPTLGDKTLSARTEPDESYNFGVKKPIPDLAIEVVITSGDIDKLQIYQRLGVPEVWFWQDGNLSIYYLDPNLNNKYERAIRSQLLPNLDLNLLVRFINYADQYDAANEFIKLIDVDKLTANN